VNELNENCFSNITITVHTHKHLESQDLFVSNKLFQNIYLMNLMLNKELKKNHFNFVNFFTIFNATKTI